MAEYTFRVAVVGDPAVGKTRLVKRLTTGEYTRIHYPTLGVEASTYLVHTTSGRIQFDIRDCAGSDRFGGHLSGFFRGANAAISVFSLDSRCSYASTNNWISFLRTACGDIPIVVCGNKADAPNREIDIENVSVPTGCDYLTVSARNHTGLEDIFLKLSRRLLADPELQLVEGPVLVPPTIGTPEP